MVNEQLTVLLSHHFFGRSFPDLFEAMGFKVLWSESYTELEISAISNPIDFAIEWQWGENDYPIREMLTDIHKNTPIFLSLNWNRKLPINFQELGYAGFLEVPYTIMEIRTKFLKTLSPAKQLILMQMPFWNDNFKHFYFN